MAKLIMDEILKIFDDVKLIIIENKRNIKRKYGKLIKLNNWINKLNKWLTIKSNYGINFISIK